MKASGPKRIRITSASASMTFDCVLRSFCSALSPTTPSATTSNVIVRISGTAVGVYLGENFASLTLGKDRSSIVTPSLVGNGGRAMRLRSSVGRRSPQWRRLGRDKATNQMLGVKRVPKNRVEMEIPGSQDELAPCA